MNKLFSFDYSQFLLCSMRPEQPNLEKVLELAREVVEEHTNQRLSVAPHTISKIDNDQVITKTFWEACSVRGLIPTAWIEAKDREFFQRNDLYSIPKKLSLAMALAAAPSAVLRAESLLQEIYQRLIPWGELPVNERTDKILARWAVFPYGSRLSLARPKRIFFACEQLYAVCQSAGCAINEHHQRDALAYSTCKGLNCWQLPLKHDIQSHMQWDLAIKHQVRLKGLSRELPEIEGRLVNDLPNWTAPLMEL